MSTSSSSAAPSLSGHKRTAAATAAAAVTSVTASELVDSDAASAASDTSSAADAPAVKRSKRDHDSGNGSASASAADASQALRQGGHAAAPVFSPAVASASRARLLSLPDAVLLHRIADAFLFDYEAVRCAVTCHATFHALRGYKLKSEVTIDEALKFADGSSMADREVRAAEAAAVATSTVAGRAGPALSTVNLNELTISSAVPLRSPWRIGLPQRVRVWAHQDGAAHLDWLPRSVTELDANQFEDDSEDEEDDEDAAHSHPRSVSALRWLAPAGDTDPPAGVKHWNRLVDLTLPDQLQTLILPHCFDQDDDSCGGNQQQLPPLPSSLTALDLGHKWAGDTLPPLPAGLTELNLAAYSGPLAELQLPHSLLRLRIDRADTPLAALRLPPQLKTLQFGPWFNASLEGVVFPASLTKLHFDKYGAFNQPLEHLQLPSGLRSLILANSFNQPLPVLPASLTRLQLGSRFDRPLPSLARTSLLKLGMSGMRSWSQSVAQWRFPPTLHTFVAPPSILVNSSLNAFFASSSLTHLDLSACFSDRDHPTDLRAIQWPPQLRKLTFGYNWQTPLTAAEWTPPASLLELQLPSYLGWAQDSFTTLLLPPALEVLHLGRVAQSLRTLHLPSTLRELHLGLAWNLPINELPHLPSTLETLAFGNRFSQPIAALQLPASLRTLSFGADFNQPLHSLHLPEGLHSLIFQNSYISRFNRPPKEHSRLPAGLRIFAAPGELLMSVFAQIDLPPQCVLHITHGRR